MNLRSAAPTLLLAAAATLCASNHAATPTPRPAPAYPMAPQLDLAGLTGSLFTFEMPWDDVSTSPLSQATKMPKPAGASGFITVKNGHFFAGDTRIRLYGINMSLGALTPTHAEAEAIAANLAKQGFNAVRIHGLDKPYIGRTYKQQGILNSDWTTFNPAALELFDYFMAQLIRHGLYLKIMGHASRIYPETPDCIDICEGLDNYLPAAIESQKKFLASLLKHVNPYTGRSYAAEPGVFAVEINNENALTHRWRNGSIDRYVTDAALGPKYGAPLKAQWNAWLNTRYGTPAALSAAWGQTIAGFSSVTVPLRSEAPQLPLARMTDWWRFVGATEEAYWSGMQDFIKQSLGFRGLVSGGQMGYSPSVFKPRADFTDSHYYWHPLPRLAGSHNRPGAPNHGHPIHAVASNSPQYGEPDPKNSFFASQNRLKDTPHIVSEYSVRFHNNSRADGEMLMLAQALFQDWDGVFMFTYNDMNMVAPNAKQGFLFNDALKKVTRVPAAIMFRRGDVAAGTNEKVYKLSKEGLYERLAKGLSFESHFDLGANIREPLRSRVSHVWVDTKSAEFAPPSSKFSGNDYDSDTNELRWKAGVSFTIDTPRSQMRTAVADGQPTALGPGVSVVTGKTRLGKAMITLTSLADDQSLPRASSMLLTVTGDDLAENEWVSPDGLQRVSGVGKNRLEAVPARATFQKAALDSSKKLRVFVLDDTGNIRSEVPVVDGGASYSFVIGPGTDSPWYLIEQR